MDAEDADTIPSAQFLSTLTGLATLRAFAWLPQILTLNHHLLETSQRPAYLLPLMQQWLRLVLNLVVAIIAIMLVTLATQLRAESGFTGVGLVSLMSFGDGLSSLVRCWTQLETSIGAISRLKSFSDTVKSELLPCQVEMPPKEWPRYGRIEIDSVSARYGGQTTEANSSVDDKNHHQSLALSDIKISIASGEKVAVCGRTGSGKSSLLLLLLGLLEPSTSTNHSMSIDSLPLHLIHRPTLRSRLIAIPQTPFFLPDGSTFRNNIDPYDGADEAECADALEAVGLWDTVSSRGGLASPMSADILSQGQKQLFSLARAVLRARVKSRICQRAGGNTSSCQKEGERPGGILLLDEMSSSVDAETDEAMQRVVRSMFGAYTIVAVAHRLDSILDFDRVLVMDGGSVVEEGNPKALLEEQGSRFGELWKSGRVGCERPARRLDDA